MDQKRKKGKKKKKEKKKHDKGYQIIEIKNNKNPF